jgi:hypothetical protein
MIFLSSDSLRYGNDYDRGHGATSSESRLPRNPQVLIQQGNQNLAAAGWEKIAVGAL